MTLLIYFAHRSAVYNHQICARLEFSTIFEHLSQKYN